MTIVLLSCVYFTAPFAFLCVPLLLLYVTALKLSLTGSKNYEDII